MEYYSEIKRNNALMNLENTISKKPVTKDHTFYDSIYKQCQD